MRKITNEFDKVIGYEDIKLELMQVVDMARNPKKYEKLGARMPHGILLDGEPGLGKTLISQCFINATGYNTIVLRKNGTSDTFCETIEKTFEDAINQQPCAVLLDDMDKFANEDTYHRDAPEYVSVQSGFEKVKETHAKVIVIGTVNDSNKLPKSLLRAGRFDKKFQLINPKGEDAEKIFAFYMRDKAIDNDVNMSDLTKMINGCSCAELEMLLNEAAIKAGYDDCDKVHMRHMVSSVVQNKFKMDDDDYDATDLRMKEIAIHEAGHIVVAEALQPGSVGFASMGLDKGASDGCSGLTSMYKSLERRPFNVLMGLAGKCASEMYVKGHVGTGCQTDLERTVELLKDGMRNAATHGYSLMSFDKYDDEINDRHRGAIAAELEKHEMIVCKILHENRNLLEALSAQLLSEKVLLRSNIDAIITKHGLVQYVVD